MASFEDRIAMLNLIVTDEELDKRVTISEIERSIYERKNGPVYTYDVLSGLASQQADSIFTFICGPDNRDSWSQFYRSADIKRKWGLMVAEERLKIRSTQIRERLKNGCNESEGLPRSVSEYAVDKRLYI